MRLYVPIINDNTIIPRFTARIKKITILFIASFLLESTSTETVGAVPEQPEQQHQKGKGYDTILEYDFTHRTGGKKWKFIGKIHNEEKLEQLRREYGVRRSTSRNLKDEFALVHFCCPFGRDIKARYKCPFSMMLRTVRRKSGQIVRKLYRSLDGHSHNDERKGWNFEEY